MTTKCSAVSLENVKCHELGRRQAAQRGYLYSLLLPPDQLLSLIILVMYSDVKPKTPPPSPDQLTPVGCKSCGGGKNVCPEGVGKVHRLQDGGVTRKQLYWRRQHKFWGQVSPVSPVIYAHGEWGGAIVPASTSNLCFQPNNASQFCHITRAHTNTLPLIFRASGQCCFNN